MSVFFPSQRVTPANAEPVWITFRTTPLLYNTLFRGWLLDSGGALPQPLSPGDAGPLVGTSSLNVYGTFGQPLRLFQLAAATMTPNADGVNDRLRIFYDLVHLVEASQVDIAVHDLAGRRVVTVHSGSAAAGRHTETWAGLDAAGNLVPPGQYLCRIQVKTQTHSLIRVRPLAVVY
jgi:hypothetical protein